MQIEYWIAGQIGKIPTPVIGPNDDTAKQIANCFTVSSGGRLPGEELHKTQRFCMSMWLRLIYVAIMLSLLTVAVGAVVHNFTQSLNHVFANVILFLGGLATLSAGQYLLVFTRITFTYHALEKDAPRSHMRLVAAGRGLPRFYDFWIAAAVSLGILVMIFLVHQ